MSKIDKFVGEYRFLSNFYVGAPINYKSKIYPTSEHLYQGLKTIDPDEREKVRLCSTPGAAKKEGQKITVRDRWDEVKDYVMRDVLKLKFGQNPNMAEKLLATEDAILIEGNSWQDYYWGVCQGLGQNILGKLLMELRKELGNPK